MAENSKEIKEQLESINEKKEATTVFSFRLPLWLKARVLEVAESKGQTPGSFASFTVYKAATQGIIGQEDYDTLKEENEKLKSQLESESSVHKQAISGLEKVKKERDNLNKKLEEAKGLKKEKDDLGQTLDNYKEALSLAQKEKGKTDDKSAKRIQQLEKELDQYKQNLKDKESKRKSLAGKNEQLERRLQEANEWAQRTPFVEKRF